MAAIAIRRKLLQTIKQISTGLSCLRAWRLGKVCQVKNQNSGILSKLACGRNKKAGNESC